MIDPKRLKRALGLSVASRVDRPGWTVTGGQKPHRVLPDGGCDCPDNALMGNACKHQLAVRLMGWEQHDPDLVTAVRALVQHDT